MLLHLGLPGPAHCFPVASRDAQVWMDECCRLGRQHYYREAGPQITGSYQNSIY